MTARLAAGEVLGDRLATGRTAEVYALGNDRVVKVLRPGVPAGEAELEALAARAVAAAGVEAPTLVGTTQVDGRSALIYARLRGPSMLAVVLQDRSRGAELAETLGRMHADMHDRDGSMLPDGAERIRDAVRHAAPHDEPDLVRAALARIDQLPFDLGICHGDFHPGNVIMEDAGPIAIDWLTATAGPTAADVARTLLLLRDTALPEDLGGGARRALTNLRHEFADAYLGAYLSARPVDTEVVASWRLPILVARLSEGVSSERARLVIEARRQL